MTTKTHPPIDLAPGERIVFSDNSLPAGSIERIMASCPATAVMLARTPRGATAMWHDEDGNLHDCKMRIVRDTEGAD